VTDIFLSYNREDQVRAKLFAEAFEAQGFKVWWDVGLRTGEAYDQVTEKALKTAKAVVVLWSKKSVESRWVRAEATLADRNKTLVPCMIEPCERPIMFELTQTAELSHWDGSPADKAWLAFLGDVKRFVGKEAPAGVIVAAEVPALPLPSKPSIAVMPFANLSGDPDQEYFADGMVLEVAQALSRFRSIFVIASGSTLSFKGKAVSAQEVGRKLGVRYVLEGSVRKGGNRIRIAVQLIDAADGAQIWTDRFEDTLEDIFDLQDKVALAVAGKIEPTIRQAEIRRVSAHPTDNMGSYDLYLRATAAIADGYRPGVMKGFDLLRRAVELDPDFAPALVLFAQVHRLIDLNGWSDDPQTNRRQGVEMVQRALKVGKGDADVLGAASINLFHFTGDLAAAQALAIRATDLNPGSVTAWYSRSILHMRTGEPDLAVESAEIALRLDPTGPRREIVLATIGQVRVLQGRFAEAIELLKEASQIGDLVTYPLFLAVALGYLGEAEAATKALARYRMLSSLPAEELIRSTYRPASAVALLLEGLALAEGKDPGSSTSS
jgi:adenylate cyclase